MAHKMTKTTTGNRRISVWCRKGNAAEFSKKDPLARSAMHTVVAQKSDYPIEGKCDQIERVSQEDGDPERVSIDRCQNIIGRVRASNPSSIEASSDIG